MNPLTEEQLDAIMVEVENHQDAIGGIRDLIATTFREKTQDCLDYANVQIMVASDLMVGLRVRGVSISLLVWMLDAEIAI